MSLEVLLPNGQVLAVLNYIDDGSGPKKWDGSVSISGGIVITSGTVSTKTPLVPNAPQNVSVGVTSAIALAANSGRKSAVFVNRSSNNISFGLSAPAVLDEGITLVPNGVWEMDEYSFFRGDVFAIASGAASNLAIQEFQ